MGPVVQSLGFEDDGLFSNAMEEVKVGFEEPVVIKRFINTTTGNDPHGVADTENFTQIRTTANISNLEAREINYPNTIYEIGDLKAEFRIPVFGAETYGGDGQTAGRRSDQIVYRGRTYRIIGHVMRPFSYKTQFYECILRQIT